MIRPDRWPHAYPISANSIGPGGPISPTMRQTHGAGEKLFVDYAGDTVPVFDAAHRRGTSRAASSSRCSARRTTPTRRRPGHKGLPTGSARTSTRLRAIGGVPTMVVCRQPQGRRSPRPASTSPAVNRTYAEMAAHYDTAILPARPRKPRDKTIASYCTLF